MQTLLKLIREKWQEALVTVFWPSVFFLVLPTGSLAAIIGVVLGGLVSIAAVFSLAERVNRARVVRRRPIIGDEAAFSLPRRGIIFTLGLHSAKPGSVARTVITRTNPELVGFLGTPETEDAQIAQTLIRELFLSEDRVKCESWSPTAVREGTLKTGIVMDWMRSQGLPDSSIVLDLTGGTATMSVAAFMAAEEREIDSQYVASEFDKAKNQILPDSQHLILITRYAR